MIEIPLRNRKREIVAAAAVDDADSALAAQRWCINPSGYAVRGTREPSGKQRRIYLHRAVLGLTPGDGNEVDHINRDPLDNRRQNLRVTSHGQNGQNLPSQRGSTSAYRGVSWNTKKGMWRAQAKLNGRGHDLGFFVSEEEAARAASEFRAQHMPFAVEV